MTRTVELPALVSERRHDLDALRLRHACYTPEINSVDLYSKGSALPASLTQAFEARPCLWIFVYPSISLGLLAPIRLT